MVEIKSAAKKELINFLTKCEMETEYRFKIKGDEQDAEIFVHRMRVELSRLRQKVRARGRIPKVFKMCYVDAVYDTKENTTEITLLKTEGTGGTNELIDDLIDIIGGKTLNE